MVLTKHVVIVVVLLGVTMAFLPHTAASRMGVCSGATAITPGFLASDFAVLADERLVVVGQTSPASVMARFYDRLTLTPIGSAFMLHDTGPTAASRASPVVAADPYSTGFYVAWYARDQSDHVGGNSDETVVRAFDGSGAPLSAEIWVNKDFFVTNGQYPTALEVLPSGNVVVTITSWNNVAIFAVYGPQLASAIVPATGLGSSTENPSAFSLGEDEAVVLAQETSSSATSKIRILNATTGTTSRSSSLEALVSPNLVYHPLIGTAVPGGMVITFADLNSGEIPLYAAGIRSDLTVATPKTWLHPEEPIGRWYPRAIRPLAGGFAILHNNRMNVGMLRTYAYSMDAPGPEGNLNAYSSLHTLPFTFTTPSILPNAQMHAVADLGVGGTALVIAKLALFSPEFVTCYAEAIVLDATICAHHGTAVYSLDCLSAALANTTLVTNYATFELAPGTWSSCPATGILLTSATNIRGGGASPDDVIIDCAGTGIAFRLDPVAVGGPANMHTSTIISHMTIRNGDGTAASLAGAIHVANAVPGPTLSSLVVSSCRGATGGGIALLDAGATLDSVTVSSSTAQTSGGGIAIAITSPPGSGTVVSIKSVTISSCTALSGSGGGLSLVTATAVTQIATFADVHVTDCAARLGLGGGVAMVGAMDLSLGPNLHINTSVALGGGGLAVEDPVSLTVTDAVMAGNSAIGLDGSASHGGGGALARVRLRGKLINTAWSAVSWYANSAASLGGGLYVLGMPTTVTSSSLVNNNAASGGGLAFSSLSAVPRAVTMISAVLSSNSASLAGGGALLRGGILTATASTFAGNTADRYGGGLFVTDEAQAVIGSGSLFASNAATLAGGGTFECRLAAECGRAAATCLATQPRPDGIDRALINWDAAAYAATAAASNAAAQGPISASDAVAVGVVGGGIGASTSLEVPSGNNPLPGAVFFATDVYNQSVITGDVLRVMVRPAGDPASLEPPRLAPLALASSLAVASSHDAAEATCSLDVAAGGQCSLPTLGLFATSANATSVPVVLAVVLDAAPCVGAPVALSVRATECASGLTGSVIAGRYTCIELCGAGTFVNKTAGAASVCSPCPRGSSQSSPQHQDKQCKPCGGGSYAFEGATACTACPPGGECGPDGVFLHAASGYWYPAGSNADGLHVAEFFECVNPDSCPGGPQYSVCASEYAPNAFLCHRCKAGAAKVGHVCQECWPVWAAALATIVLFVIVIAVVVYLIRKAGSGTQIQSLVLKIALSYLQMLSLASSFKSQTSTLFQSYVSGASSGALLSADFFALVCLTGHGFFDEFVFYMILPLIIVVVVRSVYAALFAKSTGGSWLRFLFCRGAHPSWPAELVTSYSAHQVAALQAGTIAVFLVYPTIVRQILLVFHCQSFAGELRLKPDLDTVCYQGKHLDYAIAAGAGVLVYVVGVPLVADVWFFEFLVMARKSIIVAVAVFIDSVDLQISSGGTAVVVFGVLLNTRLRPFESPMLNHLEEAALTIVAVTIISGASLRDGTDASSDSQQLLIVVLLLINSVLMASFIFLWLRARFFRASVKVADETSSDEPEDSLLADKKPELAIEPACVTSLSSVSTSEPETRPALGPRQIHW
ncbi:uncharacterized protein AMSG_07835 [Thecamonas trahens ATCC 50062]|uniref:Tyrosine-protein kinase ephrin type A/B receptor-like domain-containing protein n=1 Tax=Thecamonas trahens ATCC 50062 TaxID=461836 RepID=A0A0L0DI31_THETB|nr:hypothetical protein AMSG_07835 [Thecamonas trahens ATCC 50062]KNC51761.1 hypothetical protein AMSG_07835 [Thecamonas trahens ATCC 50062]|eukprot:XP_013755887.1 hypothetical protein AMSG_07835 [Thecamonas trahens ATCC 50062]